MLNPMQKLKKELLEVEYKYKLDINLEINQKYSYLKGILVRERVENKIYAKGNTLTRLK